MATFDDDDDSFERTIWACSECFMYKIPPRGPNGYIASEWKEADFIFKGRVKVTEEGDKCEIRVEDPATGKLFASCPVDKELDKAVERVSDSSRYFVLRVANGDRQAFVGMGFQERNDAFDFHVALEDHKKQVDRREEERRNPGKSRTQQQQADQPALNLGLKQGETIRVNIKTSGRRNRDDGAAASFLPPPPSASGARARSPQQQQQQQSFAPAQQQSSDPFSSFLASTPAPAPSRPAAQPQFQASAQQQQQQQPVSRSAFFDELTNFTPTPAPGASAQRPATNANPLADLF
eukprot:c3753_g1_i1.p1 GENE.c3753_g1_i1~~c3753_g1_i1.p1  ORF type:complete len:293 (+),score=75.64 c3753_g1_i1:66-944(+)